MKSSPSAESLGVDPRFLPSCASHPPASHVRLPPLPCRVCEGRLGPDCPAAADCRNQQINVNLCLPLSTYSRGVLVRAMSLGAVMRTRQDTPLRATPLKHVSLSCIAPRLRPHSSSHLRYTLPHCTAKAHAAFQKDTVSPDRVAARKSQFRAITCFYLPRSGLIYLST